MLTRGYARITGNLRVKEDLAPTGTYTWGVLRTTHTWDIENRLTKVDRPTEAADRASRDSPSLEPAIRASRAFAR
jgi:hypothetical protein